MESIIEFIFDNIFFVLIILFALMNLFGRSKPDENQERKQQQQQRRPSPPQSQRTKIPRERMEIPEPVQTSVEEMLSEAENNPTTEVNPTGFEDQRQAQFERLRQQYKTSHAQVDLDRVSDLADDLTTSDIQIDQPSKEKRKEIKLNLNQKLTQKGLIESVIMAEVLGPPKARQRFSNRNHRR